MAALLPAGGLAPELQWQHPAPTPAPRAAGRKDLSSCCHGRLPSSLQLGVAPLRRAAQRSGTLPRQERRLARRGILAQARREGRDSGGNLQLDRPLLIAEGGDDLSDTEGGKALYHATNGAAAAAAETLTPPGGSRGNGAAASTRGGSSSSVRALVGRNGAAAAERRTRDREVLGDRFPSNGAARAAETGSGASLEASMAARLDGLEGARLRADGNKVAGASEAARLLGSGERVEEKAAAAQIEALNADDRPWFSRKSQDPSAKEKKKKEVAVSVAPGGRWSRFKAYGVIQRTFEIWSFAITLAIKVWLLGKGWTYQGGMTEAKRSSRRAALAKWLKEGLLRLGPTFIKLGQQFSTRVDLLAKEYVDQLAELQDQVPPFDGDAVVAIVERELGRPVGQLFERFDREPLAAASLGQVHRARLNGWEVAVKVQRPGLKDLFDIDLKNLRVIAENLQKLDPKSDGAKRDWVAIYDECAAVLYQEIDYVQEGKNADRFRANFKDKDYVKVPKIVWQYTTPRVLVMEYVPGIKINRVAALDGLGLDRKRLARYSVEAYLEQLLRHGFFHADPHPGNIAVDAVNGGRLIFYDFGMMGSISGDIREGLLEAFYGVYEKDADKVLDALEKMGVLVPTGDRTAVRRTAQFFLASFEQRLAKQQGAAVVKAGDAPADARKRLTKEEKTAKRNQRLAAIGEDLLAIAADQPFRFPATFTFVVRAFSVLDGIGKGLDPRFDISEIAKPYALELLRFKEVGPELLVKEARKRWDRQAQAFRNLFRQPDRIEKISEVISRLEQGELKLRVRTLESERAFKRVAAVQQALGQGIIAATFLNIATMLQMSARQIPATAAFAASALFAVKVLLAALQVKKLDKQERLITGTV